MRRMHILLIEDDLDLGNGLAAALRIEGFNCTWWRRAGDVPLRLDDVAPDCVVLDLGLPDGHGEDLLATWRARGEHAPIIVITARTDLNERLRLLDKGADDFLVKPFATSELISRLRAVTRRWARQAKERWSCGELELEPRAHLAWRSGEPLNLSPREFQLLLELAREPGAVVTKSRLARRLEPHGEPLDAAAIEVHVSNLRKKIGAECIHTVRGVGYRLEG